MYYELRLIVSHRIVAERRFMLTQPLYLLRQREAEILKVLRGRCSPIAVRLEEAFRLSNEKNTNRGRSFASVVAKAVADGIPVSVPVRALDVLELVQAFEGMRASEKDEATLQDIRS